MSREEDAAEALSFLGNAEENLQFAKKVLKAADAANGVHRISLDEETVERASEVLLQEGDWCECRRSPSDKHDVNPPCSTRIRARQTAREILTVAVNESRE